MLENINKLQPGKLSPFTKLALEIGPLAVFYLSNAKGQWLIEHIPLFSHFSKPIFPATALFIVAIIISLIASLTLTKQLPIVPLISSVFVIVLGMLTLWFHNDIFIKIKPTIVNSLFGLILLGGLLCKKSLLKYMFDASFQLDHVGWRKLTIRWVWFFFILAAANEIVWRNFSTQAWANFKVFYVTPISIVFFLAQIPLIMKHLVPAKD